MKSEHPVEVRDDTQAPAPSDFCVELRPAPPWLFEHVVLRLPSFQLRARGVEAMFIILDDDARLLVDVCSAAPPLAAAIGVYGGSIF